MAASLESVAGCMLRDHAAIAVDGDAVTASLEKNYAETLWEPGG